MKPNESILYLKKFMVFTATTMCFRKRLKTGLEYCQYLLFFCSLKAVYNGSNWDGLIGYLSTYY